MKQESKQAIVKRLQEGLNAQQRSVPQLPAKAKAKHITVLGAKKDPKHPFSGYMVGADESVEDTRTPIAESPFAHDHSDVDQFIKEEWNLNEFDATGFAERYRLYMGRELIGTYPDQEEAELEAEQMMNDDPRTVREIWTIKDINGETVWELNRTADEIDANRQRQKLQFLPPNHGLKEGSADWPTFDKSVSESFSGEYDDEAGMAHSNLHTIARAAEGLLDTIDDNENLPEWAQEKIAKVEGMLVAVWNYLESQEEQGINPEIAESAAWRRKEGKSKSGGLNAKGVASYRRENPGSKLQTAVTTKPSKLKPGSKAAKRRKSFCARMSGVKGPMKKPNGKPTRKALALRKWNCESIDHAAQLMSSVSQTLKEMKQRLDPKCWKGKHKEGTKIKGGIRVNNCVPNEGKITKTPTGLVHRGNYGKEKPRYDDYNHGEHVNSLNKIQVRDLERAMDVHWPINKGGRPKDDKIAEAVANEDVLSALKSKLGDLLLQTLGREATDADLKDKSDNKDDKEVNPIIKKIKTDDGHEICIHGNEDDGFRISVQGKEGTTKFESLDHAEMASKMYCAHRRNNKMNSDYVEEA